MGGPHRLKTPAGIAPIVFPTDYVEVDLETGHPAT
jgi:hypothetical protein